MKTGYFSIGPQQVLNIGCEIKDSLIPRPTILKKRCVGQCSKMSNPVGSNAVLNNVKKCQIQLDQIIISRKHIFLKEKLSCLKTEHDMQSVVIESLNLWSSV